MSTVRQLCDAVIYAISWGALLACSLVWGNIARMVIAGSAWACDTMIRGQAWLDLWYARLEQEDPRDI